jgi:hypothetical protein
MTITRPKAGRGRKAATPDELDAARQAAVEAQAVADELERQLREEQRRAADEPRRQQALADQKRADRQAADAVVQTAVAQLERTLIALDRCGDELRADFVALAQRLLDTLTTPKEQQ